MGAPRPALAGGGGGQPGQGQGLAQERPGEADTILQANSLGTQSHMSQVVRARCPPAHRPGTQVSRDRRTGSRNNTRPPWRSIFPFGGGDTTRYTKVHPVSRFKKSLLGHSSHHILDSMKSRVGAMGNLDGVGGRQLSPPLLAF